MDALHVSVNVDGGWGDVAHCVSVRMRGTKKKKENLWDGDGGRGHTGVRMRSLCIQTRMSGKKKKKEEKKTYFVGADGGCVALQTCCVWMRMCCVQMWMSIKEKKKKAYFVGADGGRVALRTCLCGHGWWWTRMVVDADGGGCRWWWMRMVTDTEVADLARVQDLDNFVGVYTATTHY